MTTFLRDDRFGRTVRRDVDGDTATYTVGDGLVLTFPASRDVASVYQTIEAMAPADWVEPAPEGE